MMKIASSIAAASLAVTISAAPAAAELLYQSVEDLNSAPDTNGWCSSCSGEYTYYSLLEIYERSVISAIAAVVTTGFNFPSAITVTIKEYVGAQPDSATIQEATFSPNEYSSFDTEYGTSIVVFSIPNWVLEAGFYTISFFNPDNLSIPSFNTGFGSGFQLDNSGEAYAWYDTAAFAVTGTVQATAVPGPVAAAGLPGALALVGYAAWRRRARVAG